MTGRVLGAAALLLLSLTMAPAAGAAAAQPLTLEIVEADVADHPTVRLTAAAPAELVGQELPVEAFAVTENGERRPVEVAQLPTDDLAVILLVDTSGSMRGAPMDAAKDAAASFVDAMPPGAHVAVLGFGDSPVLAQDFTEDAEAVTAAIEQLEAVGDTALYDAVAAAAARFTDLGNGRHTVVLLSDGGDTASDVSLSAAGQELAGSGATLAAIELQTSETDGAALAELATAGNGRVVQADDPEALRGVYAGIAAQLVNQYSLAYTSTANDAAELTVAVDHDGVRAEARTAVQLPPAPAVPDAPAELRILSVDAGAYPDVALRVRAPQQLAAQGLTDASFTVFEDGAARSVEVRPVGGPADATSDRGGLYVLEYRSDAHAGTDLRVRVDAAGVRAEAHRTVTLPPDSPWERFAGRWGLVAGVAACSAAMMVLALVLVLPRERRSQLAGTRRAASSRSTSGLAGIADRASDLAEQGLSRHGRRASLNDALERAGINLRPGEYLVLCASAVSVVAMTGLVLWGLLSAIVLTALALVACRAVPAILAARRQEQFASQLPDTLQLLAGALRAGYGFLQAVDAVADEAASPTSDEFRRLVVETRLGRDLDYSLRAMAKRMRSRDFEWVVQAIDIHREVGGDLADVLDTVSGTIREREQVRRHIAALSAEGKLSAIVLAALPVAVAGAMSLINPDYMRVLLTSGAGVMALTTGLVLMVIGCLWMRKLVQLKF